MEKGQTAEACAAFEASMRLEPARGTLYNLGLCHEKLGKLASAWSELEELARTDTNEARAKDARQRAAALLPRLPRMHLVVSAPADGLVVTRDHVDVTPLVGKDTPVDPGRYTFEARVADREPYTVEVDLTAEGKQVEVVIPELRARGGEPEPTGFPIELPRRPILIPPGIVEITAGSSVATWPGMYDRTAIDAGTTARTRLGPFEVSALLGFHVRSGYAMNRPGVWDTIGLGLRYPITPAFVAGLAYVEVQPTRGYNRGSDIGGTVERKLRLFPKVAVDGRAGMVFSQRQTDGNAFVIFGEGRAQFSIIGALSLEGLAQLHLNLAGSLYDYTIGLDTALLALYAITPRLDVFAQVATDLLPDADHHTYTVGASWRTR
jgi:hypothetical protein